MCVNVWLLLLLLFEQNMRIPDMCCSSTPLLKLCLRLEAKMEIESDTLPAVTAPPRCTKRQQIDCKMRRQYAALPAAAG